MYLADLIPSPMACTKTSRSSRCAPWDGSVLKTAGGIRPAAPAGRWRPSLLYGGFRKWMVYNALWIQTLSEKVLNPQNYSKLYPKHFLRRWFISWKIPIQNG